MAISVRANAKLNLKLRYPGFKALRQSRRAVEFIARRARRVEQAAEAAAPPGVTVDVRVGPGRQRAGAVIMAHSISAEGAATFLPSALDAGRG